MIKGYHILEIFSKYAFCTEISYGEDEGASNANSCTNQVLRHVSTLLEVVDIINLILDLVFMVTKLFMNEEGEHLGKGITMLIALTLARLVARQGHILRENGGVQRWVPFCQSNRKYRQSKQPSLPQTNGQSGNDSDTNFSNHPINTTRKRNKRAALQLLYCITFTELAVFFLEDATMIFIWVTTAEFDPDDRWDLFNSWMTIVSALSAMILLVLSLFYSMTSLFSLHYQMPLQQQQSQPNTQSWARKICCCLLILLQMTVTLICRIIRASLFISFFLTFIIGYFLFLIWLTVSVIHKGFIKDPIELNRAFYFFVGIAWAIAFYFVSKLLSCHWCQKRKEEHLPQNHQIDPENMNDDTNGTNNANSDDTNNNGANPSSDESNQNGDKDGNNCNDVNDNGSTSSSIHSNSNNNQNDNFMDEGQNCVDVETGSLSCNSEHSCHNENVSCNEDEESNIQKLIKLSTKENQIMKESSMTDVSVKIEKVTEDEESNDNLASDDMCSHKNIETEVKDEDTEMYRNVSSSKEITANLDRDRSGKDIGEDGGH